MTAAIPRIDSVVFDCPDPRSLADFYARLLDWPPDPNPDPDGSWVDLKNPHGGAGVSFQRADDYRAPQWPDPSAPQQLHVDFDVDDLDAAHERALELGARLLDDQGMKKTGFRVYADPAGHPFCLCRD